MATDYLRQVRQKVEETTGKSSDIESLAEMVKDCVTSLDSDLESLTNQRSQVAELMRPFIGLYRSLTKSDLYNKVPELALIDIQPLDSDTADWTKRVFELAVSHAIKSGDRKISVNALVNELSENPFEELPWGNPAAVISSLLSRSEDWERVQRGIYLYLVKEDVEELPW